MNRSKNLYAMVFELAWNIADCTAHGPDPSTVEYYAARLMEKPTYILARYWRRFVGVE
jgi:hypothetical protein